MKQKKVLLVEENTALSFLIETILEKNYETVVAANSFYAMKALGAGASFDVLIISIDDITSDTFQLLNHVTTSILLKMMPVVVLSNSESRELQDKCEASGVAAFLQKPFDPEFFVQRIDGITGLKATNEIMKKKINLFNLNFYL